MAETMGGDIGTQILNAVQGLGVRMDRLESRMDRLETQVADLRTQVTSLDSRMTSLDSRMTRQEREVQHLRGEVQHLREDFRQMFTDMQEGFRRLNAQDELTAGTVVLMASVLRRPTDLGEDLEKRLRELQTH
jgi:chromosome segregation ATPase